MKRILKKDHIYVMLREAITRGDYRSGDPLPGEERLSIDFSVSRVTLRSALARLQAEGYIDRVDSKGTFVSDRFRLGRYLVLMNSNPEAASPVPFVLAGIKDYMYEASIPLEYCDTTFIMHRTPEEYAAIFSGFRGIFVLAGGWAGTEPLLEALNRIELPLVHPLATLEGSKQIQNGYIIAVDDRTIFREALKYLASLGHHRVGTVCNMSGEWKLRGYSREEYAELLTGIGLDPAEELQVFFRLTPETARENMRRLLAIPDPPTAIMCYSDYWAFGICNALNELNVSVPEQVSVMGYSGFPGTEFTNPPLSTVSLENFETGKAAARLMLDSASWYHPGCRIIKDRLYKFIIRQSTRKRRIGT